MEEEDIGGGYWSRILEWKIRLKEVEG
jgi:hypothetical protein